MTVTASDNPVTMNASARSPLHLIGSFSDPFTGAERELPDLARSLRGLRPTQLWSDVTPHPVYVRQGVQHIRPFAGAMPRGGMLLIGGVHVRLGIWLRHARPERIALRYNTAQHERLYDAIELIRDATGIDPELLFVSRAMQLGAGLPGTLEYSLIDLAPFLSCDVRRPDHRPFTIGRLSRDTPLKFGRDDPALFRLIAARGFRVRIMGGTCLAPELAGVEGIELLPAGAEDAADFLQSLDVFFYRLGEFTEAYGRVVLEAMASGLPVVAGADEGYAEAIHPGQDGFLVNSQEAALNTLEALAADRALRERIGHAARAKAQRLHGPEAIARQLSFYLDPGPADPAGITQLE